MEKLICPICHKTAIRIKYYGDKTGIAVHDEVIVSLGKHALRETTKSCFIRKED